MHATTVLVRLASGSLNSLVIDRIAYFKAVVERDFNLSNVAVESRKTFGASIVKLELPRVSSSANLCKQ